MTSSTSEQQSAAEPWMRNTHTELDPLRRGTLHALELAVEDVKRWIPGLEQQEIEDGPDGLPSVAFHLRHITRSLDRLLTYAEGRALNEEQLARLASEHQPGTSRETLQEFHRGLAEAAARIIRFPVASLREPRGIGRKGLPTTVGGLLVHCADHTQRHSGQMVTTAKVVKMRAALRGAESAET